MSSLPVADAIRISDSLDLPKHPPRENVIAALRMLMEFVALNELREEAA